MDEMTDEMIDAAYDLFAAAYKYRKLYGQQHGDKPVIYVRDSYTGDCIFVADSFNADAIRLLIETDMATLTDSEHI